MPANCPAFAPLLIDDDTNRVASYTHACGGPWSQEHIFTEAGKYLVICAFLPHFEVQMYGWVIVRDRD
jgi:plastocyanin